MSAKAHHIPSCWRPHAARLGPAGDFEGYLSFGLGLRTTSGPLPVRLGESTRPDGTHVVSVDVRRS